MNQLPSLLPVLFSTTSDIKALQNLSVFPKIKWQQIHKQTFSTIDYPQSIAQNGLYICNVTMHPACKGHPLRSKGRTSNAMHNNGFSISGGLLSGNVTKGQDADGSLALGT